MVNMSGEPVMKEDTRRSMISSRSSPRLHETRATRLHQRADYWLIRGLERGVECNPEQRDDSGFRVMSDLKKVEDLQSSKFPAHQGISTQNFGFYPQ